MARDRSSSIMEKVKHDHTRFFKVACFFPSPSEVPVILGFTIQDRGHSSRTIEGFVNYISHWTSPIYIRKTRTREGWLVKIKVAGDSIAKRLEGDHRFVVWQNDEKRIFVAQHTPLKEVEIQQTLLDRLIEQDISIFEDNSPHKLHSIKNDFVSCVWMRHTTGEIFVFFRRRMKKEKAVVIQDADPFWSFMSFDSDGNPSDIEILDDVDSTFHGAKFALQRLCGIFSPVVDRHRIYERNISSFTRSVTPTNPDPNTIKDCLPRQTNKGWAWNKSGINCVPKQIRALEFAQEIGIASDDAKERDFWQNVTLPARMKEDYLSKFDKKKGFFRRKKYQGKILDL